MGLWEFLQQWPRARTVAGIVASLLIHVLVIAGVFWGLAPGLAPTWKTKPGDALIVELPTEEPGSKASPSAPPPPAPRREAPAPPREERRIASAPRAPQPAPPAPPAPQPAPKAVEPMPKTVEPTPRTVEPTPPAPEPLARSAEPAPKAAEPTPPAPEPAPPAAEPAPPMPQPAPAVAERAAGAPAPSEPRLEGRERQIASLPPGGPTAPSASDVRAALGRGAGRQGQGRGGIEGDPIPLDSPDGRYSDYLEQVKRKIKQHWGFPCVKNAQTRECEHYTTSLDVQFGILKDGRVQFVDIVRVADHAIYDDYAVNAIKLASPFPPVPPAMMRAMRAGSTGLALRARFSYVVESSLTNLLR
ncbi:MAG TPA: TonB C-terminal domain-containing protein [Methylomirabilota bacterium]